MSDFRAECDEESSELCAFAASLPELHGELDGFELFEHLELAHFMAEDGELSCFFSARPEAEPAPYAGFLLDEPSWIGEKEEEEEGSTGLEASEDAHGSSSLAESKLFLREELEETPSRNARLERAQRSEGFERCAAANSPALRAYAAAFLFDGDEALRRAGERPPLGAEEFAWLVGFLRARVFKRGRQRKEVLRLLGADQPTLRAQAHLLRRHLCHQRPVHTLRSLFPHVLRHAYAPAPAPRLPQSALSAKFCAAFVRERGLEARVRAALASAELRARVLRDSKRLFLRKFPYMAYKTCLAGRFTGARLGLVAKEYDDGAAMLLRLLEPGLRP